MGNKKKNCRSGNKRTIIYYNYNEILLFDICSNFKIQQNIFISETKFDKMLNTDTIQLSN